MPIPLPELDDRRFADLVEEGRRLIPTLAPSWTDHNPSDPGITLIELFAFVAEMLMYRANRISDANKQAFVLLLRGPSWELKTPLEDEIRNAVLELRDEQRTVTAADFVHRAELVPGVARAWCLPRRDLESNAAEPLLSDAPAHVSVMVWPEVGAPDPSAAVAADLAPRYLLTTRLHVVQPKLLGVRLHFTAHVYADRDEATLRIAILNGLHHYFDPLLGGADGQGWPPGRSIYVSDLMAMLDTIDGVDYVTAKDDTPLIEGPQDRGIWDMLSNPPGAKAFAGLRLHADELVNFVEAGSHIDVLRQPTLARQE